MLRVGRGGVSEKGVLGAQTPGGHSHIPEVEEGLAQGGVQVGVHDRLHLALGAHMTPVSPAPSAAPPMLL